MKNKIFYSSVSCVASTFGYLAKISSHVWIWADILATAATASLIERRTCFVESLSRNVTLPFSVVSLSSVIPNGIPSSSERA